MRHLTLSSPSNIARINDFTSVVLHHDVVEYSEIIARPFVTISPTNPFMPDAQETLRKYFGHNAFRDGQESVIDGLLDSRSMLAVFPTGGGKSLCYQLPALHLKGLTLVISPLIALMKDQVDALQSKGIAAARLDSTLSTEDYQAVMNQLRAGTLKLLYIAPERIASEAFRKQLKTLNIDLVAIDEAHCISEWGHNFRPDYLKLAKLCRTLRVPRVLCLTATATPSVSRDIRKAFRIKKADHIQRSFHRSNLHLSVTPIAASERIDHLHQRLCDTIGSAIVYVTLQHTAESVATELNKRGHSVRAYHAGLPDEVRSSAQEAFMTGTTRIIVATIAFGMGIDKADIRNVFHYNLPKSLENYSQEIGRAGRDGAPSTCELLACGDDLIPLENFIYGDTPSTSAVHSLVDRILRLGDEFSVSIYDLSTASDVRPLVVTTLLTYLELEGIIIATRKFHLTFQAKLLREFDQILSGYDARRKSLLRKVFEAADTARYWKTFTIDEIAVETCIPRDKITSALNHLEEAGDLVLKRSGVQQGYRIQTHDFDLKSIYAALSQRFQQREEADLARLASVVQLAESKRCLTRSICLHFGEKLPTPCRHCDRCQGIGPKRIPRTRLRAITDDQRTRIRALIDENHAPLQTPRQLARFLCGIRSPATTRRKKGHLTLSYHDDFAMLDSHPFTDILITTETMME